MYKKEYVYTNLKYIANLLEFYMNECPIELKDKILNEICYSYRDIKLINRFHNINIYLYYVVTQNDIPVTVEQNKHNIQKRYSLTEGELDLMLQGKSIKGLKAELIKGTDLLILINKSIKRC